MFIKQDGSDYLLKYNINDLESAPWLNEGKKKNLNNKKRDAIFNCVSFY